jgi:hypothetical protein
MAGFHPSNIYRIMRALTNALANDRRSNPIPGLVVQPAFSRAVVLIHLRGATLSSGMREDKQEDKECSGCLLLLALP